MTFGPTELDSLAGRCSERTLDAGQCLFQEGTSLADVYVVRRGVVGLGRRTRGRRTTFLLMHPGDVVGDVSALLGGTALFDAWALTEAKLVVVPSGQFLAALELRSPFSRQWATGLGKRVVALQSRLEETMGGDLRGRVASLLHHELRGTSGVVTLTQQAIADLLGVPRTSVTRALKSLQRQGIVDLGYGHIAVLDRAALAAV
jgi:CRP-like cAMP-binding protein